MGPSEVFRLALFCVLFVVGSSQTPSSVLLPCSDGFVRIHNSCYYFSVEPETFDGAEFKCRERKSHLAVIANKRQDGELKAYLVKQYAASVPRWLGGQYNWIKKQWVWRLNGKLMRYQSFARNQTSFSDWNCLLIQPLQNYNWIGSKCFEKQYFICQTNLLHPQFRTPTNKSQPGYYIVTPSPPKKQPPKKTRRTVCAENFRPIGRKCYFFSRDPVTWQDAYHKCEDMSAQLAIFRNPHQTKKLKFVGDFPAQNFWLGGRYDWSGRSWIWAKNGKKISGELPRTKGNWMCLKWSYVTLKYEEENCLNYGYYLCQKEAENGTKRKPKKWKVELTFQLYNTTDSSRNYY